MKTDYRIISIFILLSFLVFSCKKDSKENVGPAGLTEREQAIKDYQEMYLGSKVIGFTWNGDISSCFPGYLSADVLNKTLLRVKYFRKAAGLHSNIVFSTDRNLKCQQNALMTRANGNILSHTPPSGWNCYTADGADAAQNGNISYGSNDADNIDLFMEDGGSNNVRVGHRRWILFSKADTMGFGCTDQTSTLWVINDGAAASPFPPGIPEFIAWPPKGFVPNTLVFPRWSFSVPYLTYPFQVDFNSAQVFMTDANGIQTNPSVIYQDAISGIYVGDNSIVWEPTGIILNSAADIKYHVKIFNVRINGEGKSYEYDVTLFKP